MYVCIYYSNSLLTFDIFVFTGTSFSVVLFIGYSGFSCLSTWHAMWVRILLLKINAERQPQSYVCIVHVLLIENQ